MQTYGQESDSDSIEIVAKPAGKPKTYATIELPTTENKIETKEEELNTEQEHKMQAEWADNMIDSLENEIETPGTARPAPLDEDEIVLQEAWDEGGATGGHQPQYSMKGMEGMGGGLTGAKDDNALDLILHGVATGTTAGRDVCIFSIFIL